MGFSGISYYYAVHITILATSHIYIVASPTSANVHARCEPNVHAATQCAVWILLLHPSHRFSSSGDEAQTIV